MLMIKIKKCGHTNAYAPVSLLVINSNNNIIFIEITIKINNNNNNKY